MNGLTVERESLLRIRANGKREKDLRTLLAEIDRLRAALDAAHIECDDDECSWCLLLRRETLA